MKGLCARCRAETTWSSIPDDGESRIQCDRCGIKAYFPWPWPVFAMMHGQHSWVERCREIEKQDMLKQVEADLNKRQMVFSDRIDMGMNDDLIAAAQYQVAALGIAPKPQGYEPSELTISPRCEGYLKRFIRRIATWVK